MNQLMPVTAVENQETVLLLVKDVHPNPFQPRTLFKEKELQELAEGIRENGLKEAIVVRQSKDGGYELVSGERRLRAHKINNMETIRSIIVEVSDDDLLLESVSFNAGRKALTPRDTLNTIDRATNAGKSVEEIASAFCKSTGWVHSYLRLVRNLAPELKAILQHEGTKGELLVQDAVKIAKIPNHKHQVERHFKTKGMSKNIRKTLIKKAVEQTANKSKKPRKPRRETVTEKGNNIKERIDEFHLFLNTLSDIPTDQLEHIFEKMPSLDAEILEETVDSCIEKLKKMEKMLHTRNK